MKILIAGGTGFIGQFLVQQYLARGDDVTVLGRSEEKIRQIYDQRVAMLTWDDLQVKNFDLIKGFSLIINLTGAGIADQRWTPQRKKILIESRTTTTRVLAQYCTLLGAESPPFFCASAVGVYGTQPIPGNALPSALHEQTDLDFEHPSDFSSTITRQWEKDTWMARDSGARVVNLRFGVVLGKNGGMLKRLILPFKLGLGGRMGSGWQPLSWVCIVDLFRAIDFIYEHRELSGPINIVSPHCVTQYQFAQALTKILHRPCVMSMPQGIVKLIFGEMGNELLLQGQNVFPKVLLKHGFKFEYENIDQALQFSLKAL